MKFLKKKLFEIEKYGIWGYGRRLLFGDKTPDRSEVAGDKNELLMGWINNDGNYYLFEDPLLGFAGTDQFGTAYDMYREMRIKWPHFRHCILKRQNAVLAKDLNIIARSEDEQDVEIAQFCRDMISGIIEFRADMRELLDCILFGFSISEIIWGVEDGRWIVKELKNRSQERFRFRTDQLWGLDRTGGRAEFTPIEPNKFVIMQYHKEYEFPYGQGEGKFNYWYYYFQKNVLKFWTIFSDKFASPTIMGKYPSGTQEKEKAKLLAALKAFQTDQQIIIPENVMIELLEAERQGSLNNYREFIRFLETSTSKAVLSSTLTSDESEFGTKAQAIVHDKSREEIMRSDCLMLAGVIQDQIIKPAVWFNFGFDAKVPIVEFDLEIPEGLEARAKVDEILVTKLGLPLDKKYYYENYQRPEPEGGNEKLEVRSLKGEEEEEEEEKRKEMGEEGGSLKFEVGSLKGEDGRNGSNRGRLADDIFVEFLLEGGETRVVTFEEVAEVAARWGMDEGRYVANAIDEGGKFYFDLMDWIREGVETAEDAAQVYALNADLAEAETQRLASYLTSALFTAELNGELEIKKLANAKGIEFQELGEYQFYPLVPEDAIEYFEGLIPLTREELEGRLSETRKVAFTVSDIQGRDVLEKIQDRLTRALAEGRTFAQWQTETNEMFRNEGVSPLKPFRMRTVFQTNIHNALVEGRDRMSQNLVNRGILKRGTWQSAGDSRVRPEHADYDGQTWDWNDARWEKLKSINCRCQKVPAFSGKV